MIREYLSRTRFRRQLTVIVSVAIMALALFSSLLNSWEASRRMRDYLIGQGLQLTESLARQSTLALLYHSADNARSEVDTTLAFPDVLLVEITDASHHVLLSQGKAGARLNPDLQHAATPALTHVALEQETDEQWRFGAPVYAGQEEASPFELHERQPQLLGYVHVVVSKDSMDRLVTSLLLGNLVLTLSIAALLLGGLGFLVERLIRPLNALSGLMRRAEAGESGLRARASGPRDITDMAAAFNKMMAVLEEREAELQQSRDRAVHTAQMKTQFAATVSHEVRTPLNGVVGMLDMLREMDLTPVQRESVEVAWNSSQALMELINGILDFSKLEAGKLELEEIDFDLRHQVEGVIELLARQAQQKGLDLGYAMAADVPDRIRGDSLRVRQVLINLMSNALKFTEQGEVAVRVSCNARSKDNLNLRIEVCDTGIGMDEATVQRVFESFAQADPSTTRKYGGTGLGLTISKHLVDLMGGEIGVTSQLGQGSTFWFAIPCKVADAQPIGAEPQVVPGRKALVLARDGIVRAFLEQSLRALGMTCHTVGNASEALDRLKRSPSAPFALVIVDAAAVNAKNADLVRSMRSAAPGETAFLLLDQHGAPVDEDTVAADGYLAKPLRLEPLVKMVRELLAEQSRAMSAAPRSLQGGAAVAVERRYIVLVVEDNRTNQMVAAAMLGKSGCHCEFAANGREAVEAVRQGRFDLIFMDCNMPEMDGYEATARIRELEQALQRRTPIIAMTANAQSGDEEQCLTAGMDDYLAKPITLAKLRHKLEVWLAVGEMMNSGKDFPDGGSAGA